MKCAGQRIAAVTIRSAAPSVAIFKHAPPLAKVANAVHRTTNPEVINRFMLLHEGDRCSELRRAESERILRAQPFISEAQIRVLPDSNGEVALDVRTTDEVALVLGVAAGGGGPLFRLIRLGDANIGGEGVFVSGTWRDGGPFRDGYGARFVDNQFLGRPYTLTAEGYQNPLGEEWLADATHPFYTDLQRFAWRARAGSFDNYVQYAFDNSDDSSHALRVARDYFDVGGIVRIGTPGRLSLFGASITGEDERPSSTPVLITNDGFAPDTSTQLLNRFVSHRIARANILWGVRDIGFAPVVGFDALTATQDLPVGFQLGTMFGRTLSVLGSRDDDIFMAGDLYIGAVGRNNGLRFQLEGEGRRSNDNEGLWDGVLTNARAVEYLKVVPSNTATVSLPPRRWNSAVAGASEFRSISRSAIAMAAYEAIRRRIRRAADGSWRDWRIVNSSAGRTTGAIWASAYSPTRGACGRATSRTVSTRRSGPPWGSAFSEPSPQDRRVSGGWILRSRSIRKTAVATSRSDSAIRTRRRSSSRSPRTFRRRASERCRRACSGGRGKRGLRVEG